jgi:hypothetical protein
MLEKSISRRDFLSGVVGFLAAFKLKVPVAAQETDKKKLQDFLALEEFRDRIKDDLEEGYPNYTEEQLKYIYESSFKYGEEFKKFEDLYGIGEDMFDRDTSKLMKNDFVIWLKDNQNANSNDKLKKLDEFIEAFMQTNYLYRKPELFDIALRRFLRGFMCGYNPGLCPVLF